MDKNLRKTKYVIVVDYDSQWAFVFAELKSIYQNHLGDSVLDIQHVGSTSVPGLAAKPVIDLDLIVENEMKMKEVIQKMETLGYQHGGDWGIKGREVFLPNSEQSPDNGSGRKWMRHNTYACIQGIDSLENHLKFRDYLRANPEEAKEYGALKKQFAKEHHTDIDAYVEKKTPFITNILKKAGFDMDVLEDITEQNRAKT